MENEQIDYNSEERGKRPKFLQVLGILSFINLGLGVVFGLMSLFMGPQSEEVLEENRVELAQGISDLKDLNMDGAAEFFAKLDRMSVEQNDNFYLALSLSMLIYLLGIYAVLTMFKGNKLGFHLYIIYNILIVMSVYAYASPQNIPTIMISFNLFLSAIFIFMYSRNLKWMR